MLKKLPIGIQTFEKIIQGNYVYVDKTKEIYNLITTGQVYFLSRPRRFGKSTLCSTLEALFLGKKELFKGLWIETTDYDWKKYPVVHISWGGIDGSSKDILEKSLAWTLHNIADINGVKLSNAPDIKTLFQDLLQKLYKKGPVAVIVDEYDKPLLDSIADVKNAVEIREALKKFYEALKDNSKYTKFIFITGVTKFSKVSIFSGFNNLDDISMDKEAETLFGYTERDLKTYFSDRVEKIAKEKNKRSSEIFKELKRWYDGYCFYVDGEGIYNPFSILSVLKNGDFRSYWFATGTPTFLLDLIKKNDYDVIQTDSVEIAQKNFDTCEIDTIKLSVILLQSGYLTIKSFDEESRNYTAMCPNYEVRDALTGHIFELMTTVDKSKFGNIIKDFNKAITADDIELFCTHFKDLLESIPYTVKIKSEKYYQSVLFLVMRLIGLEALAEVPTDFGRIDLTFQTKKHIYLIECKYRGTPDSAIKQIIENEYAVPYKKSKKKIVCVGISFVCSPKNLKSKKRKVEARWKIKPYTCQGS